jgi:hypothetical protein
VAIATVARRSIWGRSMRWRGGREGSRLATYVDLEGERGQYIHTVLTKLIISRELSPP